MKRRNPAFTLIELLISCTLMSMIAAFIAVMFTQSRMSFEMGSSRVSLDQKARDAERKISPFLASAFSVLPGGAGAIYQPISVGATGNNVTFSTTECWLSNLYPPAGANLTTWNVSNPGAANVTATIYNPSNWNTNGGPLFYSYRISYVRPSAGVSNTAAGDLWLEWVTGTGPGGPFSVKTVSGVAQRRALVRSTRDAMVVGALFTRLYDTSSVIQIDLNLLGTARTANGQQRTVTYTQRSSVNLAAESMRTP